MTVAAHLVLLFALLVGFDRGTALTVSPYADASGCLGNIDIDEIQRAEMDVAAIQYAGVDFSGGAKVATTLGGVAWTLQCDLVNLMRAFKRPSMLSFVIASGVTKTFGVSAAEAGVQYAVTPGGRHRCAGAYGRLTSAYHRWQAGAFISPTFVHTYLDLEEWQLRSGLEFAYRIGGLAPHVGIGLILHPNPRVAGRLEVRPVAVVGVQLAPMGRAWLLTSQMAAPKEILYLQ